jgi:hypothetical protein
MLPHGCVALGLWRSRPRSDDGAMRAQVNFEIEPAEDRKCQRCRATIKLARKLLDPSTGREVRMFECTTCGQ